jgi:thiamine-phosphate pyrophosphorylase
MIPHSLPRVLLVTDRRLGDPVALVERALDATGPGRVIVQLREKDLDGGPMFALARRMREVTSAHGALLVINDRLDVALAAGADGVHLPERGLDLATARRLAPELLVGVSTHAAAGAIAAAAADYVVLGPIRATPSKAGYGPPLGLDALREAAAAVADRVPLFAIGGIETAEHVREAIAAGAHGVAGIRAFSDPAGLAELARAAAGQR